MGLGCCGGDPTGEGDLVLVDCFCCAAACGVGEDRYAKVGEGGREAFFDVERFDGVVDCCFWVLDV